MLSHLALIIVGISQLWETAAKQYACICTNLNWLLCSSITRTLFPGGKKSIAWLKNEAKPDLLDFTTAQWTLGSNSTHSTVHANFLDDDGFVKHWGHLVHLHGCAQLEVPVTRSNKPVYVSQEWTFARCPATKTLRADWPSSRLAVDGWKWTKNDTKRLYVS